MPGHPGGGVIHDQHCNVALVIAGRGKPRHPAVEKRGIADHRQRPLGKLSAPALFRAVRHGNAGAHADRRIHRPQRRRGAQRIAADIAKDRQVHLFQYIENPAVRASRAQCRRARRQILHIRQRRRLFAQHDLPNHPAAQFARFGEHLFVDARNAQAFHIPLNVGFQFLHHIQRFYGFCKFANLCFRQRIYHPQLQNAGLRQRFFYILIANPGANYAHFAIAFFHAVEVRIVAVLRRFFHPRFQVHLAPSGIARHHDIFGRLFFIFLGFGRGFFALFHKAPGVGNARGQPHDHRHIQLFAQLRCQLKIFITFLAVCRLQNRHMCCLGNHPRVLFVLAAVHARVVRHGQHQPRVYPGIRRGK